LILGTVKSHTDRLSIEIALSVRCSWVGLFTLYLKTKFSLHNGLFFKDTNQDRAYEPSNAECDFVLLQWCKCDLCSSGVLHSLEW